MTRWPASWVGVRLAVVAVDAAAEVDPAAVVLGPFEALALEAEPELDWVEAPAEGEALEQAVVARAQEISTPPTVAPR